MNIQPSVAAASVAGTNRAAGKGGEADNQATEATRRQSTAEQPAGKSPETPGIEAGEQAEDRGGDGREMYDDFNRSGPERDREDHEDATAERTPEQPGLSPPPDGSGGHLDFQA